MNRELPFPKQVSWHQVALTAQSCLEPYPPERLWAIDPAGALRGTWTGDHEHVLVPFRDLAKLHGAILLHSHPPGMLPTRHDVYQSVIASSPLLVVVEGERAHLVRVWHRRRPGIVGEVLRSAPDLATGLQRVGGVIDSVPLALLPSALSELESAWTQFLAGED